MPIDLHSSLKGVSQWAFGSSLLNSILSSSVFVAIAVALLMGLLIMFMYPAKSGTPFSVVGKIIVYMFFGTWLIIFLHDGVVRHIMDDEASNRTADAIMQNTTMQGRRADPSFESFYQPVSPTTLQAQPMQPIQPIPPAMPIMSVPSVSGGGYQPIKAPAPAKSMFA